MNYTDREIELLDKQINNFLQMKFDQAFIKQEK